MPPAISMSYVMAGSKWNVTTGPAINQVWSTDINLKQGFKTQRKAINMHVLITCKYEKNPIKNSRENVMT